MADLSPYVVILREIHEEWNTAEHDIKLGEQVCKKVITPAVKELRYGGRRLADALFAMTNGGSEAEIRTFLQDAKFDCHRARHDAIDAATAKMAIDVELMASKLGFNAVLAAYPQFAQFNADLQHALGEIASSRAKRQERQDIYAEIEAAKFPVLVTEYRALKANEPVMKKLAARSRLIGGFGYFLAAVTFGWGVWTYYHPYVPPPALPKPSSAAADTPSTKADGR